MPCAIIPLDYTIGFLAKELTLTLSGIDAPNKIKNFLGRSKMIYSNMTAHLADLSRSDM